MLEGRLGDFRLPDLLQLLWVTGKTGSLALTRADEHARLRLEGGRVAEVTTDVDGAALAHRLLGSGQVTSGGLWQLLDGAEDDRARLRVLAERDLLDGDAVETLLLELRTDRLFDLLLWDRGTFSFEGPSGQPAVADVDREQDALVAAAHDRLEAWPALQERIGGTDAVLVLDAPPHRDTVTLTADRWRLLAMIDGRRPVAELVRLWGQGSYRTHAMLADLLDQGIVAPGRAPGAGMAGRLTSAFATLGEPGDDLPAAVEDVPTIEDFPAAVEAFADAIDAVEEDLTPAVEFADALDAQPFASPLPTDAPPRQPVVSAEVPAEHAVATQAGEALLFEPAGPRGLRPRVRPDRLGENVDAALVQRLIRGVEQL